MATAAEQAGPAAGDARTHARFELRSKQLAFKGMANLIGVRANAQLDTATYYPDEAGERRDIAITEGMQGLRRLRPSIRVPAAAQMPRPRAPQPPEYLLEAVPAKKRAGARYPLLRQFCSSPHPTLEAA